MSRDGAKLVRAALAGDDAKVKRLLKAKADVDFGVENAMGVSGCTALQDACLNGSVGAVRLLLKSKATGARRDREELLAAARPQPRALVKPA